MKSCTFFGHREIFEDIEARLKEVTTELIVKKDITTFYVGNHGNFDAVVERVLANLKKQHSNINCYKVFAYIPNKGRLNRLDTLYPEGIESVPPRFAIVYRNKWMIKRSEYVITYVKDNTGGAAYFKRLAEKKGKNIINIV